MKWFSFSLFYFLLFSLLFFYHYLLTLIFIFLELLEESTDVWVSSEPSDELLVVDLTRLVRIHLLKDRQDDPVDRVEVLLAQRDCACENLCLCLLAQLPRSLLLDHGDEHLVDLLRWELAVTVLVKEGERRLELLLDASPVEDPHHREVLVDLERPVVVGIETGEHLACEILVHRLGHSNDEGGLGDLVVLPGVLLEWFHNAVELIAINYIKDNKLMNIKKYIKQKYYLKKIIIIIRFETSKKTSYFKLNYFYEQN